jgi:hypothetical protein
MSVHTSNTAPPGTSGGPPSQPPYPWRLFVGMLVVILVGGAVLAVLLGLNPLTFHREEPAVQPTSITAATSAVAPATPLPTAALASAPTVAPALAPTAAQTAVPVATAQAPSAPGAAAAATGVVSQPTLPAASGAAVSPTAQAEPTPVQAAVSPELAAAIINGYDNYWSVRVRAMGDPTSGSIDLESVMAGDELAAAYKTLSEYRDGGEAYQATVDHQIWITRATPNAAEVVDRFTASTLKLDPETKEPVEATPQVEQITGRFVLQTINGVWKVVGRSQED